MAEDAWSAVEGEDLDKAEKIIRRALRTREGDCVLWSDLGLILQRRGSLRAAEKAFRTALFLRSDHEDSKTHLASLLASRGFYRQALRLAMELVEVSSPHREFHMSKVEEYRRLSAPSLECASVKSPRARPR
jgi:Flp pilus assembly protein TadD